uniref:Uncharacterized protein n=1 Tax=Setaria italica TaxID=4555 RepID=K3Y0V5_SETIT
MVNSDLTSEFDFMGIRSLTTPMPPSLVPRNSV